MIIDLVVFIILIALPLASIARLEYKVLRAKEELRIDV
jgi:hypothetical protein